MKNSYLKFKFDEKKVIEAIQHLAIKKPGITKYYIGKIFFFADREHLKDWGRPISGDYYVAMPDGPAPSTIINLINDPPSNLKSYIFERLDIKNSKYKETYSKQDSIDYHYLSRSDITYLNDALEKYNDALKKYGENAYNYIRDETHEDEAWKDAWGRSHKKNNELDISIWLTKDQIEYLKENSPILKRV